MAKRAMNGVLHSIYYSRYLTVTVLIFFNPHSPSWTQTLIHFAKLKVNVTETFI